MGDPAPPSSASARPFTFSPHRLDFEAGPSWLSTGGNGPTLSGYTIQARLGQSLTLSENWALAFQGVFSQSQFSQGSDSLSRTSVGLELGPEVTLARNAIGFGLYGGFHQSFYYSQGVPWATPPGRASFDNVHVSTFSLRPTILWFGGLLATSFQWDQDLGLQVPGATSFDAPIPANPTRYSLLFTLDILKALYAFRGSYDGPSQGAAEFLGGTQVSALAESSYSYSFNQPTGTAGAPGVNTYRTNDPYHNRFRLNQLLLSLDHPATAESPFGFGFDFNFGQDPGTFAPQHSVLVPVGGAKGDPGTQYFAMRRAVLRYRFPVLEGFTLEAGQFPTTVGYEVVDGPSNAILSRGLLNTLAEPYNHAGATLRMRFSESKDGDTVTSSTEGVLGIANGWDSVLGHEGGPTVITGFNWTINPQWSTSLNYLIGAEQGGARGLFDGILTWKPSDQLTLAANVDIGHGHDATTRAGGTWEGLALYQQWAPANWWNLGVREEYFIDQQGLRSGIPQDLMSLTAAMTFLTPYGFGIGPEIRHDHSFRRQEGTPGPFFAGANPADSNTTFGVRAFWRYPFPY